MGSAEIEKKIFEQFLAQLPNFASRPVAFEVGPDPPDFICSDAGGARIGVELSEWIDEDQIAHERPQYQLEEEFLKVINSRAENPPSNIGLVRIFEKTGMRLKHADAARFRTELYEFIKDLNECWTALEDHDSPQGVDIDDDQFSSYPLLQKYLIGLICQSQVWQQAHVGNEWIAFTNHGGAYSPDTALKALERALARKTAKYRGLHSQLKLAELHLLLYYDQGFHYNSPFDAPGHGFREVVRHLRDVAMSDHGVFDRIFLFIPATRQVARIY